MENVQKRPLAVPEKSVWIIETVDHLLGDTSSRGRFMSLLTGRCASKILQVFFFLTDASSVSSLANSEEEKKNRQN